MALELRIAGPGLDVVRKLQAGEPELVLGRDAECDVCLPDPQRNVSRRHLSLWLEQGELHFRVLSVVNGVEMPSGEAPPGTQGVLPLGQTLKLAEYTLCAAQAATPAVAPAAPAADPWAVFDREGSGVAPVPEAVRVSLASGQTGGFSAPASAEDDPFGEWGFDTFGPGGAGGGPVEASGLATGDMPSFFQGLGLDPATIGALSQGELETMGRLVRVLVLGVLELHASTAVVKAELRAEDRTLVATKDNNPLKSDWPQQTKLRYLFGGRAASVGFTGPERALRELLVELIAHNGASGTAARAALEATLKEFEPGALKTRLLGEGTKLFEGTRSWDAYCKYYEQESGDLRQWTQRLLDRYFSEAYLRESLRIRRETPARKA